MMEGFLLPCVILSHSRMHMASPADLRLVTMKATPQIENTCRMEHEIFDNFYLLINEGYLLMAMTPTWPKQLLFDLANLPHGGG